jgi:predicted nucleic acid-binding protein
MAHSRGDQEHLGIDTNVLVAYLDKDHPSHRETDGLADKPVALNPTIVHEAYHTLVFKMKWIPEEASEALTEASMDAKNRFINQTLKTTSMGLLLATEHNLGGRDALILASLLSARITNFGSYDMSLLVLRPQVWQGGSFNRISRVFTPARTGGFGRAGRSRR